MVAAQLPVYRLRGKYRAGKRRAHEWADYPSDQNYSI